MPKVKPVQNAAIDIMDFMHFKDIHTSLFLSYEETNTYLAIFSLVENITNKLCSSVIEREILNHYLLCALEISLSSAELDTLNSFGIPDNMSFGVLKTLINKRLDISISVLSDLAEKNGVDRTTFLNSLELLLSEEAILNTSPAIRFRLASKIINIIHPLDSILFYSYLNDLGILNSGKYNSKTYQNENHLGFVRVGLLMEFEILRLNVKYIAGPGDVDEIIIKAPPKGTSPAVCRDIANNYKYLIDQLFDNSGNLFWFQALHVDSLKSASYLLMSVNKLFRHKRLFNGTLAKWPGSWGILLMILTKRKNIKQPIYCESNNKGNVSEYVCRRLAGFNITLSERTLYLRYKNQSKKEYLKVKFYSGQCAGLNSFISWDYEDFYYKSVFQLDE
ncbi:hypothetical protein [Lelliottia amnigena]|uniref:hypothetical protein n=1 Tax=Lelliottia amnigena TaxID=61646 RepID=UPI00192B3FBA|nr:hypothetical protein [Lelliottia amnigena]MBL5931786.1 hypothetical protein [Lelliottia amnigena]